MHDSSPGFIEQRRRAPALRDRSARRRRAPARLAAAVATVALLGTLVSAPIALAGTTADQLDPSFGVGGKVTTAIGGLADSAAAVAVQTDGRIVIGGQSYNGASEDFALARYNPDGTLDPSFGTAGSVLHSFSPARDSIFAVALQTDGKIVAAGLVETTTGTNDDFIVARFNPDGSLDGSFGAGGVVTTDFTRSSVNVAADVATSLVIQPDGRIVAAGYSNSTGRDFALARYNPDGSLDPTFGNGGKVITDFGPSAGQDITALVLQPDGRLVAVGEVYNYVLNGFTINKESFALARYLPDGSLDPSFGVGGQLITALGSGTDVANAAALQSDGGIVVAGYSNNPLADFALVRYLPDGTLDPSFGTGGKSITTVGPLNDIAFGVALQADRKIVATGYSESGATGLPNQDFALARYNPDGSLDTSFGSGGTVVTDFGLSNDIAQGMAFQPDGLIVAAGYSEPSAGGQSVALARYFGGPPFATAPGAPTNIIAAAGDMQASVSWVPPVSNGGSSITGYTVTSSGGQTAVAGGGATTATIGGLADGTTYTFMVSATNSAGTGAVSAASAAVTPLAGAAGATSTIGAAGGTVTTDPGAGPTPSDPLTTSVSVPAGVGGDSVAIAQVAVTETPPSGYEFVGQQVDISSATMPSGSPLTIVFTIDPSVLLHATGMTAPPAGSIDVTRAEAGAPVVIGGCTALPPAAIVPDPCVLDRHYVGSDLQITILSSTASHWNTAVKPVPVTVADSGYGPKAVVVAQGGIVLWTFNGSKAHSATENLKLGPAKTALFDSGPTASGRYGYVFRAAGTYPYWSTVKGDTGSFAGSVAVPVGIAPASGGTTTTFTVTWSASTLNGYVFDVQYRFLKSGSKSWSPYKLWQNGGSGASGSFRPPSGAGTYAFSARLRNTATAMASLWSPETSIVVQ